MGEHNGTGCITTLKTMCYTGRVQSVRSASSCNHPKVNLKPRCFRSAPDGGGSRSVDCHLPPSQRWIRAVRRQDSMPNGMHDRNMHSFKTTTVQAHTNAPGQGHQGLSLGLLDGWELLMSVQQPNLTPQLAPDHALSLARARYRATHH